MYKKGSGSRGGRGGEGVEYAGELIAQARWHSATRTLLFYMKSGPALSYNR